MLPFVLNDWFPSYREPHNSNGLTPLQEAKSTIPLMEDELPTPTPLLPPSVPKKGLKRQRKGFVLPNQESHGGGDRN